MTIIILRSLFFLCIVRPIVYLVLGVHIHENKSFNQKKGPIILVANHNSHLDTIVLMCLFPFRTLLTIKPVAAKDYFCKGKFSTWFFTNIIGIIPIDRNSQSKEADLFENVYKALDEKKIVLLYPEGTRGNPGKLQRLKKGIAHLAKNRPKVPVLPLCLIGLDKALPKGEGLLVPFVCDVFIGDEIYGNQDIDHFMNELTDSIQNMKKKHHLNSINLD